MKDLKHIKRFNEAQENLNISDVISSKNYTTDEVKQLIKHFVKTADFIDFNREYGITGWEELDKWLEQNVK
jgi:hypothetical protein